MAEKSYPPGAEALGGEDTLVPDSFSETIPMRGEGAGEGDLSVAPEHPGRYDIREEYGRGGQARVMLAMDTHMGRPIAWKELLVDPQAGSGTLSREEELRFLREARVTAQLEHPNIIPVYEVGRRPDGRPYYTMRLVRGRTLAEALQSCHSLEDRMALLPHLVDLCQAIAYAHSQGVIHRDVKPHNVMVGEFGETVLLDWGLAKILGKEDHRGKELVRKVEQMHHLGTETVAGWAVGTPSYMSPEQARGAVDQIDERSDVWGLGAVLYEILTGKPPFGGPSPLEIVEMVVRDPLTPVTTLCPHAPPDLVAVTHKALMKKKDDRYQTAGALARDITAYMTGGRVRAYEYSSWELLRRFAAKKRPVVIAAGMVLCVVLTALILISWAYRREAVAREGEQEERLVAHHHLAQAYAEKADRLVGAKRFNEGRIYATASLFHNPANAMSPFHQKHFGVSRPESARLLVEADSACYMADHSLRVEALQSFREDSPVEQLALSPDGRTMAGASTNGKVILWDIPRGVRLADMAAHTGQTKAVLFGHDGTWLASAGEDGLVRLWSFPALTPLRELAGHRSSILSIALSPDGQRLASGGESGHIRLWNRLTGEALGVLKGHTERVREIVFSPDGRSLASASWDRTINVWDLETQSLRYTIDKHSDAVYGVAYSPDGQWLASASYDRLVGLWKAGTGELVRFLKGNRDAVYDVTFSPDGQMVGASGFDSMFRLWDTHSGKLLATVSGHTGAVLNMAFSQDGRLLASSGHDNKVNLWSIDASQRLPSLEGHKDWAYGVTFTKDGAFLASASWDRTIKLWDVGQRRLIRTFTGPSTGLFAVAISPDNKIIATVDNKGELFLWSMADGALLASKKIHSDRVYNVRFSPDGQHLATSSRDGAKVWEVATLKQILTIDGHRDWVYGVDYSPDGQILATASHDHTARLWDARDGSPIRTLEGHTDWVTGVAFSHSGKLLSTSGKDCTAILWDLETGRPVHRLTGHKQWINSVSFSPDDRTLATASDDSSVILWSVDTGLPRLRLPTQSSVLNGAFSPDGRILAVGNRFSITLHPLELSRPPQDPAKLLVAAQRGAGMRLSGFELIHGLDPSPSHLAP